MRRDVVTSLIAIVFLTVVFGLLYPLAFTGVAQVLFHGKANGSRLTEAERLVGSSLIGQDFQGKRRYFQSRPSATGYDAAVTAFSNLGPNSRAEEHSVRSNLASYLKLNRPYDRGLTRADVPIDAVTQSGSGVDPDISEANARIQAHRVAQVRRLPLSLVMHMISDHTDGRFLGVFGEPGVGVLELNLALDREASSR